MRLLGYEWVTLIGHIGFIDCHLRMVELGVLPRANYVLLAPRDKVVNSAFLTLFASKLTVIEDPGLVDELLPYQRLVGDQFIAVRGNGALAEPWAHAAARTQVKWAETQHGPLVTIPQDLLQRGRTRLRAAGVTADWFVALHIREGGYHGDGPGTTRQHRSASVGDYLDAIAQVTSRGGAVVRLGDKSMTPLKGLPGVFDYAHSDIKSAEMDLFLCAQARLFVGTTSGLTTAVQALGTPMLLVNCISNDCQFWHDKTDFTLRLGPEPPDQPIPLSPRDLPAAGAVAPDRHGAAGTSWPGDWRELAAGDRRRSRLQARLPGWKSAAAARRFAQPV